MGEVFAARYELVDPIGRGGVGAVWRTWDHRRRRYVAAKILQQSDAHTLLRFVREQAVRIDHPHVLAPASWAADDDKVLFTMDLVTGGSLAHLIGDYGPLPHGFVCVLLDQLLAGLAAVHAEGVIHRDIKPANLLLEATGTGRPHLRLSDFGIAMRKGEPRLTETNYVVGTPGYFAPEQMLGAEPDFPADLFAVGLVAAYLLQGAKPDAKALVERFTAQGTPPPPKDIPESLWQVVATLLQPDPEARFRTATGARKALASASEMLPAPGPDDELIEVFDHIGPLPQGFGPEGPLSPRRSGPVAVEQPSSMSDTGSFHIAPPPGARRGTDGSGVPPVPRIPPGPPTGTPAPGPGSGSGSHSGAASNTSRGGARSPYESGTSYGTEPPSQGDPATGGGRPGGFLPHSAQPPHPARPSVPAPLRQPEGPPGPPSGGTPLPPPFAPSTPSPHRPPSQQAPGEPSEGTTGPVPREISATRPFPAGPSQVPPQGAARSTASPAGPQHRAPQGRKRRQRRPGPPAKVAVPLLVLALLCFAVGAWALTQS